MLLRRALFISIPGLCCELVTWSDGRDYVVWCGLLWENVFIFVFFSLFLPLLHSCKKIYTWQPEVCLIVYHSIVSMSTMNVQTYFILFAQLGLDLNYIQMTVFITICLGVKSQLFPVFLAVDSSLTWNAKSSMMYVQQSLEKQLCLKKHSFVSSNVNRSFRACWWGCLLRNRRRSFPSFSSVYCLWITPRIDSNSSSTTTWALAPRASCS